MIKNAKAETEPRWFSSSTCVDEEENLTDEEAKLIDEEKSLDIGSSEETLVGMCYGNTTPTRRRTGYFLLVCVLIAGAFLISERNTPEIKVETQNTPKAPVQVEQKEQPSNTPQIKVVKHDTPQPSNAPIIQVEQTEQPSNKPEIPQELQNITLTIQEEQQNKTHGTQKEQPSGSSDDQSDALGQGNSNSDRGEQNKLWESYLLASSPTPKNVSAYINPNDEPFFPPTWIHSYIRRHHAHLSAPDPITGQQYLKPNTTRWIQWKCSYGIGDQSNVYHCGGLADRLKGILMGALFAVLDNKNQYLSDKDTNSIADSGRIFLLKEWEESGAESLDHPLAKYWEPNLVNWNVPTEGDSFEIFGYRAQESSVNDMLHRHPCSFVSDPQFHAWENIVYTGNYFTKTSVLQSESCLKGLWTNQPDNHVSRTIFFTLFQFSSHLKQIADRLRGPIKRRNYYLAAHIRTGNFTNVHDTIIHSTQKDFLTFAHCIEAVQAALESKCGHNPMAYLASDNADAKNFVVQRTKPGTVHTADVEIMHVDKFKPSRVQDPVASYEAVMGEFKVLMDSTCLIGSDSGFSNLASELSRVQDGHRCYINVNDCGDPKNIKASVEYVTCPDIWENY